jgi:hypothetical protein
MLLAKSDKVDDDEKAMIHSITARLRQRLKLTKEHGYFLNTEPLPLLRRRRLFVVIQQQGLEAAARLELHLDFDLRHFDELTGVIERGAWETGKPGSSVQIEALCEWILEVSTRLIRVQLDPPLPSLQQLNHRGSGHHRFSFFTDKVSKAQIWLGNEQMRFKQLKLIAEDIMGQVGQLCDERYLQLTNEPGGQELIKYEWNHPDSETVRLTSNIR